MTTAGRCRSIIRNDSATSSSTVRRGPWPAASTRSYASHMSVRKADRISSTIDSLESKW
ncbi:hypothetical protein [Thermocatellispora tengchongensis]|uniref:hypothetical protein n=1 Tax=Thermocatellispora tengchongensis TaxID=1073253 RepID=UPI00364536CC